jgi:PPOX class probable F420-dependent enzyme
MITADADQDQFITDHRWGVLTTLRADGHPVSSVIAYAREGDTLIVSTPGTTFKRRSLDRDDRVTLCIVSNQEPFNFVSVEGRATIETSELVAGTLRVFENIADIGYQVPDDLDDWLTDQQRVLIRIHPERTHGVIR